MNLADPELELIDPTPNIHSMFLIFDKTFFWAMLSSRCVVRWSKRMYSCAGITSYEGRGGLIDIALSEPLLKLRPRKDFIETLLHEMIHAYLFVTNKDQNRDGHGPNFQAHMHRINRAAGLNISIYHDFHEEVQLYQTHWWRCNGPCQLRRPHFGIVRRPNNRAPGPSDCWWNSHQRNCGGTFVKIKEPEKPEKKSKKNSNSKPNADITKYINNNNDKEISNKNIKKHVQPKEKVLKDSSNIPAKPKTNTTKKSNSATFIVSNKNVGFNPELPKRKSTVFIGTGLKTDDGKPNPDKRIRTSSAGVLETVRSVWANKQIGINNTKPLVKDTSNNLNPKKHKADDSIASPPSKMKKIDDYFKTTVTSVLKNIYGQDFNIAQSKNDEKIKVISTKNNLVQCPICVVKIDSCEINKHLDECLNKGVIEKLVKKNAPVKNESKEADQNNKNNKPFKDTQVPESTFQKKATQDSNNRGNLGKYVTNNPPNETNSVKLFVSDANRKITRTSLDLGDNDFTNSERMSDEKDKKSPNLRRSDSFKPASNIIQHKTPITLNPQIKVEPSCSKSDLTADIACPCCGDKLNKSVDEHLDECLSFFENNSTIPKEGTSNNYISETIVIDDDDNDRFDESQTFNATGTKFPCPCCLKMVEEIDMNGHLDKCLS